MNKRIGINIFLIFSIIILIAALIKSGAAGRFINIIVEYLIPDMDNSTEFEEYPEFIYETFIDGDGNEMSVKMEKRAGTVDGEEVVFYEDTIGSEVIYYHFYKGFITDVDTEKIVFIVKEECLNANPEDSFYEYNKVEDYELVFYFDDYPHNNGNSKTGNRISINTEIISDMKELIKIKSKNLRVCNSKYKDPISGHLSKQLDFYHR